MNKVFILGRLGRDPEVRFTQSGRAVANFPVATSEQWTDRDGNRQERTEWHKIEVWGKQAEICGQYLSKGRQVFVEGAIRTEEYEKDGQKRYSTKISARDVRFLDGQGGAGGGGRGASHDQDTGGQWVPAGESGAPDTPSDDEIPF